MEKAHLSFQLIGLKTINKKIYFDQNDLSIKLNHFRIGSFTLFSERKLSAKFYPNRSVRSRQ